LKRLVEPHGAAGLGSNEGKPFTEDPLGTLWDRAKKPSSRQFQPHRHSLPRQISGPVTVVAMNTLRW